MGGMSTSPCTILYRTISCSLLLLVSCDSHLRRSNMSVTLLVLVKIVQNFSGPFQSGISSHIGVFSRFTAVVQAGLYYGEVSLGIVCVFRSFVAGASHET